MNKISYRILQSINSNSFILDEQYIKGYNIA